jgi:hypothetical protein
VVLDCFPEQKQRFIEAKARLAEAAAAAADETQDGREPAAEGS